jgi:hypothetical protein
MGGASSLSSSAIALWSLKHGLALNVSKLLRVSLTFSRQPEINTGSAFFTFLFAGAAFLKRP